MDREDADGKIHFWEFQAVAWGLMDHEFITADEALEVDGWFLDNFGKDGAVDRDQMADALITLAEEEGEEEVENVLLTIKDYFHDLHLEEEHRPKKKNE